jgi:predicted phage terminase large subunit-like protein
VSGYASTIPREAVQRELERREAERQEQIARNAWRILARRSMADFALYTDARYRMNWHHKVICDALDRWIRKDIKRLAVFTPPRHGKSELVSRKLPAYLFGVDPDTSVISTSYSADLASRMNRDVQRIIDSERYRDLFPDTRLFGRNIRSLAQGSYLRNSDIFEIVGRRGVYRSAGVGGGITGMGGDYIIIDDPVKNRKEATSETYRNTVWDWYTSTLYTRLEKDGCILLTMTRWHEDDLAGRVLAKMQEDDSEQWTVVDLPAICEKEGLHDYDIRRTGEALWRGKYNEAALQNIKLTVGSYDWSALYQQQPHPAEGGILKTAYFRYWDKLPDRFDVIIQSWDCAFKDGDNNDFVAGHVWGRLGGDFYLIDRIHDRMGIAKTMQSITALSEKWPRARAKLIEDKANGTAVIELLTHKVPGLIPVEPQGGKVVRAQAIAPYLEAGNIYLPNTKNHPWIHDMINECANFPNGSHDDDVDAMTQAIINMSDYVVSGLPPSEYTNQRDSYWLQR